MCEKLQLPVETISEEEYDRRACVVGRMLLEGLVLEGGEGPIKFTAVFDKSGKFVGIGRERP